MPLPLGRLRQRHQLGKLAQVGSQLVDQGWTAEGCRRVVERQEPHPPPAHPPYLRPAVEAADPLVGAPQQLGCKVAKGGDHLGRNQLHLLVKVGTAVLDLGRQRVPVAWRPALQHVGDKDLLAAQADPSQQLLKQLAGPSDKGQALFVLGCPGRLSDEHHIGVGVSSAEDDGGPAADQLRAAGAPLHLPVKLDQPLAALRCLSAKLVASPEVGHRLDGILFCKAVTGRRQGPGWTPRKRKMARPVSLRGTGLLLASTAQEVEEALAPYRAQGLRIGFVPTMGAIHAGHLSLVERAKQECDAVVVSIFVNPLQFDDPTDLAAYPRQLEEDLKLLEEAGVAVVFAPAVEELYPPGFSTAVTVGPIAERFEGQVRGPDHFRGVATVVLKLLNIVRPATLYLGQKDAQQVAVLKRMVRDLNVGVEVVVCPTVREPDGLALSSRNGRLSAQERDQATVLYRALQAGAAAAAAGAQEAAAVVAAARAVLAAEGVEPEYLAVVGAEQFEELSRLEQPALLIVAARFGGTRLIDNLYLQSTAVAAAAPTTEAACNG